MNRLRLLVGTLLGALTLTAAAAGAQQPKRILFVGNSYTGSNNLPQIFRDIAESAGSKNLEVKAITPGGRMLKQHLQLPATLALIDEGKWDVVILQGQSQESAVAEEFENVRAEFLQGAAGLYDRVKARSPRAKVVLFQTWARHPDAWRSGKQEPGMGRSPAEMQARIRTSYQRAAAQRPDFTIAPVGDAWALNYRSPKAIRLHRSDNSHPEFSGSYLAALVIHATLQRPANLGSAYRGSLTKAEAKQLQQLAAFATIR